MEKKGKNIRNERVSLLTFFYVFRRNPKVLTIIYVTIVEQHLHPNGGKALMVLKRKSKTVNVSRN
jgi:hypothetical protein